LTFNFKLVILNCMANKNILVKKDIIERKGGVAILDLERYQAIERKMREYEKKEKLLKSLAKFENLAKWGRSFARKKKITPKQVLEND